MYEEYSAVGGNKRADTRSVSMTTLPERRRAPLKMLWRPGNSVPGHGITRTVMHRVGPRVDVVGDWFRVYRPLATGLRAEG